MGFSPKLLAQGESVVMELRTHVKKIVAPLVVLVLTIVAALLLAWWVRSNDWPNWIVYVVLGLALLAVLAWVVVPILKWRTSIYVITNRRLITREGIITRTGRDIPLYRINDVTYEKDLLDRLLGCGTLVVSDATEKAGVKLYDVPRVEQVHVRMNELLFQHDDGSDDGEFPPGEPPRGPVPPTSPYR
ncbi:PH domain-containing protein [Luteipulveratus sp. YIM 133132]|uniref:PH domain-containing protein n=1 Tax=Luteipulveratus flavus TaxID=3031728 RepID=A0ABT6CBD1_9MICO|nr:MULTISPECIES: PH domain-containing protein [unclassified Luteipulveratus]MDE9367410.1 PH domain-containing protein [Luteipulveratus sp. YIM 133132]MDF8266209.1 PH domain-containing protein [Luteipulveratus sp. YIM 133296]